MSDIFVKSRRSFKSLKDFHWQNIPEFAVITGVNGSGKTHLLEIIAATLGFSIKNLADREDQKPAVISGMGITFGDALYVEAAKNIEFKVSADMSDLERQIDSLYRRPFNDSSKAWKSSGTLYDGFWEKVENHTQVQHAPPFEEFRARITPAIVANERLAGQNPDLALLFLAYAMLAADARMRNIQDDEIVRNFGEPPWDLLNEIFDTADLPFRAQAPTVPTPSIFTTKREYSLRFYDTAKGVSLSPNDLSAGEKVIVAMVFLYYTTQFGKKNYKLLLLDEPDTHLHPSFIKKYMTILKEVLVEKKRTRVIMTTHSPITVALVPESSIYVLNRDDNGSPLKVSRAHALETLLDGVPALAVRYDQRRPIFVENQNDVHYYDGLFAALRRYHDFVFEPIFLAPHSGTSNCTDVIAIVKKLVASGVDQTFGIIDWDLTNKAQDFIHILGKSRRYSIENYLLDPIFVVLGLIKHNKAKFSDFGINEKMAYTDGIKLTQAEVQTIVDQVLAKVRLDIEPRVKVILENGFTIEYSKAFMEHNGHAYETKLKSAFPELGALIRGKDDGALKREILPIINDFTTLLAVDVFETLDRLLGISKSA